MRKQIIETIALLLTISNSIAFCQVNPYDKVSQTPEYPEKGFKQAKIRVKEVVRIYQVILFSV